MFFFSTLYFSNNLISANISTPVTLMIPVTLYILYSSHFFHWALLATRMVSQRSRRPSTRQQKRMQVRALTKIPSTNLVETGTLDNNIFETGRFKNRKTWTTTFSTIQNWNDQNANKKHFLSQRKSQQSTRWVADDAHRGHARAGREGGQFLCWAGREPVRCQLQAVKPVASPKEFYTLPQKYGNCWDDITILWRQGKLFHQTDQWMPGDSVRSLKEFRHNSRLLVSRYEDKVRMAAERKRHCENVILSAAKEQERLQAADNISEADVKGCKDHHFLTNHRKTYITWINLGT